MLVGGDSGIGKTRLIDEAACSFKDTLLLRGECLEQSEVELPYAPLLGALRPLVRSNDPALKLLSNSARAHLSRLLPSLAGPEQDPEENVTPNGQARLFESLLELLHVLSLEQTVTLLLEDIHWADGSTRAFIAFLGRNLTEERLLTIATYRTDELHRRHPLRPLLADLTRLERTRRLELEPLCREDLAEIIKDLRGSAPEQALLDRLLARTDGNPLYVEELLDADLSGTGPAPESLRDVFLLRAERLGSNAREAAQTLAVGVSLDEQTIGAASDLSGSELSDALRQGRAEQLLVVTEEGNFRFRHALLREALYEDLLPGERVSIHCRLAKALEQAPPPSCEEDQAARTAAVAAHYAAAGDQRSALQATVEAARAAIKVHAYTEAAELTGRALNLWPHVPDADELTGTKRFELLELAADVTVRAGAPRRGEMLADAGLAELDPQRSPFRYSRLLTVRGRARWRLNQAAKAREDAQQALALLPPEPTPERAQLLSWVARTEMLRGRYQDAIAQAEIARKIAGELKLPTIAAEALNTLGTSYGATGCPDEGEQLLRDAIAIAAEHNDDAGIGTHYSNLADMLNLAGRTDDALTVIREAISASDGKREWLRLTYAEIAFEAGDWPTARSSAVAPSASLMGVTLMYALLRDAEMALAEGDHERARERLREAEPLARESVEAQWHGLYGSLDAELQRREGNLEAAQEATTRALDQLETCTDDVMRIVRVTAVGLAVEADRALRARVLQEHETERDALLRVDIHLGRLLAAAGEGGPVEQAWLASGSAEHARANGDNDPQLWQAAAAAWEQLGRPYCAALMRWREAEALTEAESREEAATVASAALETSERLGAGWLTAELRSLIARARLSSAEPADEALRAAVEDSPFGLTARELQVLALLADGASNRQIGETLFMAEKTASVHVSRILSKLDVRSRTQAAAVAHRLHLTSV